MSPIDLKMMDLRKKFGRITFVVVVISAVCFFLSCKKNVAGPKGDPGADGAKGNVVQSHTKSFVHPTSAWTKIEFEWESVLYVPEITKDVLMRGEVKVYMQVGNDWYDLPYAEGLFYTKCRFVQGLVYLTYYNTHSTIPERPAAKNFRVVVLT